MKFFSENCLVKCNYYIYRRNDNDRLLNICIFLITIGPLHMQQVIFRINIVQKQSSINLNRRLITSIMRIVQRKYYKRYKIIKTVIFKRKYLNNSTLNMIFRHKISLDILLRLLNFKKDDFFIELSTINKFFLSKIS